MTSNKSAVKVKHVMLSILDKLKVTRKVRGWCIRLSKIVEEFGHSKTNCVWH